MFDALSESIQAIVDAAINGDWKGLVDAILATIQGAFDLGSSALDSSDAVEPVAGAVAE